MRFESAMLLLDGAPLAYGVANRAAIEEHWQHLTARNDRLWNGAFFMFSDVHRADGALSGRAHRTDFATFMHWRDHGRSPTAIHVSGTSMPVTSDGVLLAVRMAAHTANAGQLYFPAGALDADDLVDGRIDVMRNIRRELVEETGLAPPAGAFDARYVACHIENAWYLGRRCRLELSFEQCRERFAAHMAATGEDEATEMVPIAGPDDAARLSPYARALALWHFGCDSQED